MSSESSDDESDIAVSVSERGQTPSWDLYDMSSSSEGSDQDMEEAPSDGGSTLPGHGRGRTDSPFALDVYDTDGSDEEKYDWLSDAEDDDQRRRGYLDDGIFDLSDDEEDEED